MWPLAASNDDILSCNLRFAGQYADDESGLHYNRFRYYDNETGQYLTPDPIGLAGGVNPYGYVHNPVGYIDPLGLACICPPLTKGKINNYLLDIKNKSRQEIINDLKSIGLKVKGQSPDGRFVEFVDKKGNVRAKIHPADKVTTYDHLHAYDSKGNPLDANLNIVDYRSLGAHIEIRPITP